MSISVTCTVTIEEHKYEAEAVDMEIITVQGRSSSSGTFARTPPLFLEVMMNNAIENAQADTLAKLNVIKGKDVK